MRNLGTAWRGGESVSAADAAENSQDQSNSLEAEARKKKKRTWSSCRKTAPFIMKKEKKQKALKEKKRLELRTEDFQEGTEAAAEGSSCRKKSGGKNAEKEGTKVNKLGVADLDSSQQTKSPGPLGTPNHPDGTGGSS